MIDRTFNCVSIDTDTSTSDTAVVLASGVAGAVDSFDFERALHEVALSLTKQVARDGEGAEKLIEVHVDRARDAAQAKRAAKAIVNSPLVKTAVHGADPNWGRVAMAVGKCSGDTDIDQERVVIRFADAEVYPRRLDAAGLTELSAVPVGRRCADPRQPRHRQRRGDRVGMRPHRRLRSHQRRLHDLSRWTPAPPGWCPRPAGRLRGGPAPASWLSLAPTEELDQLPQAGSQPADRGAPGPAPASWLSLARRPKSLGITVNDPARSFQVVPLVPSTLFDRQAHLNPMSSECQIIGGKDNFMCVQADFVCADGPCVKCFWAKCVSRAKFVPG